MCLRNNNPDEACRLQERVDAIESRVTRLEVTVDDLRKDTREGFNVVNSNINLLSQQIANMDMRIMEREKWGDVFRSIAKWTARTVLAVVAYAAGVNLTRNLFPAIFN